METLGEGTLTWRRLAGADLPMLADWLREPQVARWWNHEHTLEAVARDFGASVRGEEPGEDLVVSLDGHPIGLLQRAVIGDYPEDLAEFEALIEVPDGAVELDYLIADAALRGRGLGSRMIAAAVQSTWSDDPSVPAVLVAVVAANTASWRALEKAGLTRIAEGAMSPENPLDDPLHYIYRADRPQQHVDRLDALGRPTLGFLGDVMREATVVAGVNGARLPDNDDPRAQVVRHTTGS